MIFNFFLRLKYYFIRLIEKIPILQIIIYNLISNFHFFFPHEKDYYGLKKLIKTNENKDFIDVGGNIGLSTIGFRQLGYKNRIIIFEPDKHYCVKKLKKLKSKISNIKILDFALSDKNEKKNLYQAYFLGIKMHFLSSFDKKYLLNIINQVYKYFKSFFKIKKRILTLKNFDQLKLNIKPCFIKIDVEGYDHKVIKGMFKTIKKHKPIILVELNKENFFEINEILKKNINLIFLFLIKKNLKKLIIKQLLKLAKILNVILTFQCQEMYILFQKVLIFKIFYIYKITL